MDLEQVLAGSNPTGSANPDQTTMYNSPEEAYQATSGQYPSFLNDPNLENTALTKKALTQQQLSTYQKQWANNPDAVAAAAAFSILYPHMDPTHTVALVKAGYDTKDKVAQFVQNMDSSPDFANQMSPYLKPAPQHKGSGSSWFGAQLFGDIENDIVKPVARVGQAVAAAPLQAGEGVFRSAVGSLEGSVQSGGKAPSPTAPITGTEHGSPSIAAQTTLGQALKGKSLGQGYFPGGEAAAAQAQAAREAAPTIGGHALTPGRLAASLITEPGTRPFNLLSGTVDAAVTWKLDPTAAALGQLSDLRAATKTFSAIGDAADAAEAAQRLSQRVGVLRAARNAVIPQTAEEYLHSAPVQKFAERVAAMPADDPSSVYHLDLATGRKIAPDLLMNMVTQNTPEGVTQALRDGVHAGDVTGPLSMGIPGFAQLRTQILDHTRMGGIFGQIPEDHLDINNPRQSVTNFERALQTGRVPAKQIPELVGRMIQQTATQNTQGMLDVTGDAMKTIAGRIASKTGDENLANDLTTLWKKSLDSTQHDARAYFIDETGRDAQIPGVTVDGQTAEFSSPHLYTEGLNHNIPLWSKDDVREVRRATSTLARLRTSQPYKIPVAVADSAMSVWKAAHVLRPALAARIMGDAQAAMGANGLTNVMHPIHLMGLIAADDGRLASVLRRVPGIDPILTEGVTGQPLVDAAEAAGHAEGLAKGLTRTAGNLGETVGSDPKAIYTDWWERVPATTDEGLEGWTQELSQLSRDPIAKAAAGASDPQSIKDAFWDGDLSSIRGNMARNRSFSGFNLGTRAGSDRYVDSIYSRIGIKSAHDPRLVDAIASGELDGTPLMDASRGWPRVNRDAINKLRDLRDTEGLDPGIVKHSINVYARQVGGTGQRMGALWDRASNWMFASILGRPDNMIDRAPGLRELYWNRAAELMPFTDPAEQQKILASAENANAPKQLMKALQNGITRGSGDLKAVDVDRLAQGHTLDQAQKMFHDLTNRNQFFDALRVVAPFGDAWKLLLKRWATIGVEQPKVLRRLDQVITAARAHDPFVDLGINPPHQGGFFFTDQNGDESFMLPGSQFVTQALTGVPTPLVASAKGLNLLTGGFPLSGPGMSLPAAALVPKKPGYDWLRNMLMPVGEPDASTGGIVKQFIPPFAQKILAGLGDPQDQRQFNNSVSATAKYLLSTGKYAINGPHAQQEMDRLLSDATQKAKYLYLIRGVAQATSPSAPSFEFLAKDKSGRLLTQQLLASRYNDLRNQAGDPEAAALAFIHEFGPNAFYSVIPDSRQLTGKLPATNTASKWAAQNPDLASKYPDVYGLFAPTAPGGSDSDFSMSEYQRQIDTGERAALTPKQMLLMANRAVATIRYDFYRNQVRGKPTTNERQWLDQFRAYLMDSYPGYQDDTGLPGTPPSREMIVQLANAVKDPRIAKTQAGQGAIQYLIGRDNAVQYLIQHGHRPSDGVTLPQGALGDEIKTNLADWAHQIIQAYPAFANIYDAVFRGDQPSASSTGGSPPELAPIAAGGEQL